MIKKKIGICLIVVSVLCLVFVVMGIHENIAHSGPVAGKITSYKPPFYAHGLLVVIVGVVGVILFLVGIYLIAQNKM